MPLTALTKIAVSGTYVDALGAPIAGSITFVPRTRVADVTDNTAILPKPVTVTLDAQGSFSVQLPATDDPDATPVGFQYQVTESFTGFDPVTYALSLPSAGGPVKLAAASQTLPPIYYPSQAGVASVNSVGPDSHGNVQLTANDVNAVALGDSRLTDARVPLAHASSHALTGTDPISASQIGAATTADITNAVTAHTAASDPHPQYLTQAEGDAAYGSITNVAALLAVMNTGGRRYLAADAGSALVSSSTTPTLHPFDTAETTESGYTYSGGVFTITNAGVYDLVANLYGMVGTATGWYVDAFISPYSSGSPGPLTYARGSIGIGTASQEVTFNLVAKNVTLSAGATVACWIKLRSTAANTSYTPSRPDSVTRMTAGTAHANNFAIQRIR